MVTTSFEARVQRAAEDIYKRVADDRPSAFRKDFWMGKVMDWALQDDVFKTQMFRFVDVYPALHGSEDVGRHLKEYFDRPDIDLSDALGWGVRSLTPDSLAAKLVARGVDSNVRSMAGQFIVGETPREALPKLRKIRKQGAAFSLAPLGEAIVSEAEADAFAERYLDVLDSLSADAPSWAPLGDSGDAKLDWGVTPRVNVSIKPSSMTSRMHPEAFAQSVDEAKERLRPIVRRAIERGAFVHFDMEHRELKSLTLALYRSLLEEPEFRGWPHSGLAIQMYLRESRDDLEALLAWSRERGQPITVRLIKGAYWDQEIVHARQNNWPPPVYTHKADTDVAFEDASRRVLENHKTARLACGSHNIRSIVWVRELARELHVPDERVEYQVLHGMADPIKNALVDLGLPVRLYAPVGELVPGMAYLVRRLLENTSQESFLRRSFGRNHSMVLALADPRPSAGVVPIDDEPERSETGFANEPPLDWTLEDNRKRYAAALDKVRASFPIEVPIRIDQRTQTPESVYELRNPNDTSELVARVAQGRAAEADRAVESAVGAFARWRHTSAEDRAAVLFRAAELARERRFELAALETLEVGKAWSEADGDVCEAIDFLEYYAREMLRLAEPRKLGRAPGEDSRLFYEPRGPVAVIAPWNFPLAISTGMTSAALVAGNTVVYKPSSESAATGWAMIRLFRDAGLPEGVLNFVPGPGPEVGGLLVSHPAVAQIAFTGSREVGLGILRAAAENSAESPMIKHVIAELGGKNAILVDTDADFDEAVQGVVYSAFGYQGQKCSACSRLILPDAIHDRFVERLVAAVESIPLGPVENPHSRLGAVVSKRALDKIEEYVRVGKSDLTVAVERRYQPTDGKEGHFPPVVVFTGVDPGHKLAQEEIFGPVLSVIRVKDFDEGLKVANETRFGLTGAVYSRSPENIAKARREFRVGNLYINRGSTGAIVERHPFGGFKQSGLGTKAGGPDYLQQFMLPRVAVENTTRHGFTPEVS